MRRPTYTDDQIIQAGLALKSEKPGQPITAHAIKTRLGGGKHGRIQTVWSTYLEEVSQGTAGPASLADLSPSAMDEALSQLPESLQALVIGLARRLAEGNAIPEHPIAPSDTDDEGALIGRLVRKIQALEAELESRPRPRRTGSRKANTAG